MQVMKRLNATHFSNVEHETKRLVNNVLASVEGTEWPATAEYCVEYRLKTWPMGYDDGHLCYFDDEAQMNAWLDSQREWACQEDNEISYVILKWDLGPTFVTTGHYW